MRKLQTDEARKRLEELEDERLMERYLQYADLRQYGDYEGYSIDPHLDGIVIDPAPPPTSIHAPGLSIDFAAPSVDEVISGMDIARMFPNVPVARGGITYDVYDLDPPVAGT